MLAMAVGHGQAQMSGPQRASGHAVDVDDKFISPRPLDASVARPPSWPDTLDAKLSPAEANGVPPAVAFHRLPSKVIQRILWLVDADAFASLVVLNRTWHHEAQSVELYAHHVSRCPSYALSNNLLTGPFRKHDLLRFKAKLAAEVRRNLFEAYLRPRETLVNLISISANSSAAFPVGEAYRFSFSPGGQTLLALGSSRIFVLDLTADAVVVKRELKTLRRPIAASITDDGSLLAVLSSKHQANVYGLTQNGVQHLQVLVLDNPPRTIALAHEGTVLAAAYEGGVEVFSLAANALSTDRRAVRCEAVDSLTFSGDGSMVVGSSQGADDPNTVVISAPFYSENDPDLTPRELHSRMWTTQILFPNNSSTCSHAALIPSHAEGDANWLFAFDHMLQSFRAVRTDDTRTGITYFLTPPTSRRFSMPSPSIIPAASGCGDMVVAGFTGLGIWIYGIPGTLAQAPDMGSVVERHEQRNAGSMPLTSATGVREPLMAYSPSVSGSTESIEDDSLAGKVDWRQSLFVKCRRLPTIDGISSVHWVERPEKRACGFTGKRLVVVAPGGVSAFAEELGDESMPVDGGRLLLLDFDYAPSTPRHRTITVEVGENEPELLTEHHGNHDVEVAMERRRTVRQMKNKDDARTVLGRSITAISPPAGSHVQSEVDYGRNSVSQPSSPADSFPRGAGFAPYQPSRARDDLHRAATAAGAGVYASRFPPRAPLGSPPGASSGHVIYRRPIPHESDADRWVPPPPPYSSNPSRPGPEHVRTSPRSQTVPEPRHVSDPVRLPPRSSTTLDGMMLSEQSPTRQVMSQYGALAHPRPLGVADTTLDTLTEMATPDASVRGARTPSVTGQNLVFTPVSPESTGYFSVNNNNNNNNNNNHRRGGSNDARQVSDGPPILSATVTHPVSPPLPAHSPPDFLHTQSQSPSPLITPSADSPRLSNGSTAKKNHSPTQDRLNQPVPPPPTMQQQQQASIYIPPNLQPGPGPTSNTPYYPPPHTTYPTIVPPSGYQHYPSPPSAGQLANLHRRVSQSHMHANVRQRPLSIATSTQYHHLQPYQPPQPTWTAPISTSQNWTQHSWSRGTHSAAAGYPRPDSRSPLPGQISRPRPNTAVGMYGLAGNPPSFMSGNHSTPDLSLRPKFSRLDTVESVATVATDLGSMNAAVYHPSQQAPLTAGGVAGEDEAGGSGMIAGLAALKKRDRKRGRKGKEKKSTRDAVSEGGRTTGTSWTGRTRMRRADHGEGRGGGGGGGRCMVM